MCGLRAQLYTSGSTGKPKGVEHTLGGYMIGTATTFKYVFDHHLSDVYWCTADCGWITGHSYVAYGARPMGSAAPCSGAHIESHCAEVIRQQQARAAHVRGASLSHCSSAQESQAAALADVCRVLQRTKGL